MNETFRYQKRLTCSSCQKETVHLFYPPEEWRCAVCEDKSRWGDALSDIAKAAMKS